MKHIITSIVFLFSFSCYASSDSERTNLANVTKELDHIIKMVDQIKHVSASDNRVKFEYKTLKRDLILIRQGINDHINESLLLGRSIKSLSTDYMTKENK